ncbi:MAG: MBL fold metallo-hydrolase [Pseudomonadota bacterium]
MFQKITRALVLAALLTPVAHGHGGLKLAQGGQDDIDIEATDLGDGLHMLVGQGGNLGVLAGDDGVFVIDSQFANIAPKNLAKIDDIAGGTPKFLVNTHWHGDHTGGNANFGATIIAHDNVRERLTTDQNTVLLGNSRSTPAAAPAAWPVITFDDDIRLHLNGQTIEVFHTPNAHTDGDAMIMFQEANVLHMGDVFFVGRFPFIDVSSGGTVEGYMAAMKQARDRIDDKTRIIPGHGRLASRADLVESIEMLEQVTATVRQAMSDGMDADAAVVADSLAPWADSWGAGFISAEVFIRLIYADFERVTAEAAATETPATADRP